MTRIEFERTGGFMGRKVSLSINLDELPPDQAQIIGLLLDESDFFNLPENTVKTGMPDSFLYTITVTKEKQKRVIHTSETTAPEKLRPLILDLSSRARARK
jgi:hypothetical protein